MGRGALMLEGLGLALVLTFVAAIAYLPHAETRQVETEPVAHVGLAQVYWDWLVQRETDDYEYTVHVDENMHWSRMAGMERAETIRFEGIFAGLPADHTPLDLRGIVHERGYYFALLELKLLTGLEWIDLIRFLPALWAAFTAFTVWAALRPWPGALVAAGLVGLVPTSARFLGPGFLVPIGFGLAWVAGGLLLTSHVGKRGRTSLLLLLLTVWAFFIHLIAGFALVLLLLCTIPFEKRTRSSLILLVTALLPIVGMIEVFREGVEREIERVGTLPIDLTVFDQLGIPFLAAWGLGCALLVLAPDRPRAVTASALASVIALSFIVIAIVSRSGAYALYDRWHQPFVLLAAAPAAYAIVRTLAWTVAAARRARLPPRAAGGAAAVALLLLVTGSGVAGHVREPYYRVISDDEWRAYEWVAENVNDSYDVFLAEPWGAVVLNAMTGKTPHAYLIPGAPVVNGEDWSAFLAGEREDAAWLVERDVTFVVTRVNVTADYEPRAPLVTVLPWETARRVDALRE